jgi:hypothetical protein
MLENSDKMTKSINKEILKIPSNQIYQTYILHNRRLIQNMKRYRLLDTMLGLIKATLRNLLIKMTNFLDFQLDHN